MCYLRGKGSMTSFNPIIYEKCANSVYVQVNILKIGFLVEYAWWIVFGSIVSTVGSTKLDVIKTNKVYYEKCIISFFFFSLTGLI